MSHTSPPLILDSLGASPETCCAPSHGYAPFALESSQSRDVPTLARDGDATELADARFWLEARAGGDASAIVYDPPYAVGTPVRGREDGSAGSVFAPFGFLHETLRAARAALREGGICIIFADWRRMADMGYLCSTVGLRPSTCVAWVRNRPGTGGLLRSAWDPILLASRGVPDAVDRAAVRNVIEADYPTKRKHPYGKPAKIFEVLLPRICRANDLVLDPFAGSGVSRDVATRLGFRWAGCDIDPEWAVAGASAHERTTKERNGAQEHNAAICDGGDVKR